MPGAAESLTGQIAGATERLRTLDLQKPPGTAEVIDWVQALQVLGLTRLDPDAAAQTLGSVLKYREDADTVARRRLRLGGRCLTRRHRAIPTSPNCARRSAGSCAAPASAFRRNASRGGRGRSP